MQRSEFSNTLYKTEPPQERFGSSEQDGASSEAVFIFVFLPEPPWPDVQNQFYRFRKKRPSKRLGLSPAAAPPCPTLSRRHEAPRFFA